MNAIFKKENVYVVINKKDLRDEFDVDELDSLVYDTRSKKEVTLYGGRVNLHFYNNDLTMKVDGVPIREIERHDRLGFYFRTSMELDKAAAFLNQMENLGIDSFLENYRNKLIELKKELEDNLEKIEQKQSMQDDKDKSTFIDSLKKQLSELTCLLFCLLINMNAGLDNQCYTDAYNEIINQYF